MKPIRPRFTAKDRAVWRRWLEENHAGASEVWLVFYKKHTGKPGPSYNDAVEEALCFGWFDVASAAIRRGPLRKIWASWQGSVTGRMCLGKKGGD